MSLTADDTELALLLPYRAELSLVEYLPLVFLGGAEEFLLPEPEAFGEVTGHSAILYHSDEDDHGLLCHVQGWDMGDLVIEPATPMLMEMPNYNKALIFLFARPYLLGFFADWKYFQRGAHHFKRPQRLLRRRVREKQRLRLEGHVIVRRSNKTTQTAKLYDFSPGGASFYTDIGDFRVGEIVLIEFDIFDCGTCETTATIARSEAIPGSPWSYLVGVHFNLTKEQHKRAEQLYLCRKADAIQNMTDPSRYRWRPPK